MQSHVYLIIKIFLKMFKILKYKITTLIFLSILFGCDDSHSKKKFRQRVEICENVFFDSYIIRGNGAFGGDLDAIYLTDGENYSVFIDTYDTNSERIGGKCIGDSVKVEIYKNDPKLKMLQLTMQKKYSIKQLIENKQFE